MTRSHLSSTLTKTKNAFQASETVLGANVHLYQSTFTHESRILKITQSLAKSGIYRDILIMARYEEGLPRHEKLDEIRRVERIEAAKLPPSWGSVSKVVNRVLWLMLVLWRLLHTRLTCVNCHSLLVLPVGVVLKLVKRCRLVYDTHELETETIHVRGLRRLLAKSVEQLFVRFADDVIVVGDSIGDWYRNQYGLTNLHVIRNTPTKRVGARNDRSILRRAINVSDEELVFLYQGQIGAGRGIELLIEAFLNVPNNVHLVFLGYGSKVDLVKLTSQKCPHIHYHPAVAPEVLAEYTYGADVGLSVIENMCLSYYYCLPNKLFEYLNCRIPVIVSDFPEMGALVDAWDCGWKVAVSADAVRDLVTRIDAHDIKDKRRGADQCSRSLSWEHEESRLLRIYRAA